MGSIEAKNVNHPGHSEPLNEKKYGHIKKAILHVLKSVTPEEGMSFSGLESGVNRFIDQNGIPRELFPKPGSVRWYTKSVQLDLEARDLIERIPGKSPLRFRLKFSCQEQG